jgi:hypothetical protein
VEAPGIAAKVDEALAESTDANEQRMPFRSIGSGGAGNRCKLDGGGSRSPAITMSGVMVWEQCSQTEVEAPGIELAEKSMENTWSCASFAHLASSSGPSIAYQ